MGGLAVTPDKERAFLADLPSEWLKEIYLHVRDNHRGKENAITLPELFGELQRLFPITLRVIGIDSIEDLRRLLADTMPFCSGSSGIYYPANAAEVREFHEWLRSRSVSLFARLKKVEDFHRDLLDEEQLELPL